MSKNDAALIAALREAGHTAAADHVRDTALAGQLEAAGHADIAEGLKAKLAPAAAPAASPPRTELAGAQAQARQAETEVITDALHRAGIWSKAEDNR